MIMVYHRVKYTHLKPAVSGMRNPLIIRKKPVKGRVKRKYGGHFMKVYAFMADGLEEVECLTVVDLLRRAGIETVLTSISGKEVITGAHGIKITSDVLMEEISETEEDVLFLPGGMPGTKNLAACKTLTDKLIAHNAKGGRIAAICAAPTVFGELGFLKGKKAVCYPGMEDGLIGATVLTDKVVTDGNITTSRAMGTAMELGLELVRILAGADASDSLRSGIVAD